MFLQRACFIVPKRAMSSKASGTKTPAATTSAATTKQGDSSVAKHDDDHHDDEVDATASISGQTKINYNREGVGFKASKHTRDTFFNPLLSPPPRSPRSPEDFRYPATLGHWKPLGFDYQDPVKDNYVFHELTFVFFSLGLVTLWVWSYMPDYKNVEWAKREAFLRTAKREALGLPLVDPNVVDPDRIVLPTEEELAIFDFEITQ